MRSPSAKYIAFDGGEGGGKSTQVRVLMNRLRELGIPAQAIREPGGTPLGEKVRSLLLEVGLESDPEPLTEMFLFNAARVELLHKVVLPLLDSGTWVISDRSFLSSIAYQGYGRQYDPDFVRTLCQMAVGELTPHLTLILDAPIEVGLARRLGTTEVNRLDLTHQDFHQRVRDGFHAEAQRWKLPIVDASLPLEKVAEQIWTYVTPFVTQYVACK